MVKDLQRFGRIGVLMGGPSSEREVSLLSGQAVFQHLRQLNPDVVAIDIKTEDSVQNTHLIKSQGIDCAFIALHGRFGEDGEIQKLLDDLKIPYTGSGVVASRLAMDKVASREIFSAHGLSVPQYEVCEKKAYNKQAGFKCHHLQFPLVIKPATHGSSVGLSIIDKEEDLKIGLDLAFSFDERIIIEEYIKGKEVTVGILAEEPLPVIEIVPKKRFFDYEAKYQPGMTEYKVPAQLEEGISRRVQEAALLAHKLLGCYGCCRVDIILSNDSIPFILEVNTIPGLTSTSLLPKAARLMGIDFTELCLKLIELAYEKE